MSDLRTGQQVTLRVTPETREQLDALAFLHDTTIHEVIRTLIDEAASDPIVTRLIDNVRHYRERMG